MGSDVKRYRMVLTHYPVTRALRGARMGEAADGAWVTFDDYAAALSRVAALEAQVAALSAERDEALTDANRLARYLSRAMGYVRETDDYDPDNPHEAENLHARIGVCLDLHRKAGGIVEDDE